MRAPAKTFERAKALRREMTLPEIVLWQVLRGGQLGGLRFRRQHPAGPYILDFFCASARLAVEVDGVAHDSAERIAHDAQRGEWLMEQGVRVLRFAAADVLDQDALAGILATIVDAAAPSTASRFPSPVKTGED